MNLKEWLKPKKELFIGGKKIAVFEFGDYGYLIDTTCHAIYDRYLVESRPKSLCNHLTVGLQLLNDSQKYMICFLNGYMLINLKTGYTKSYSQDINKLIKDPVNWDVCS